MVNLEGFVQRGCIQALLQPLNSALWSYKVNFFTQWWMAQIYLLYTIWYGLFCQGDFISFLENQTHYLLFLTLRFSPQQPVSIVQTYVDFHLIENLGIFLKLCRFGHLNSVDSGQSVHVEVKSFSGSLCQSKILSSLL